jgi:acyl-CoA thioester hydrolase
VSPNPPLNCFELSISVEPEDIDDLGHVNNVVYLRWMQDVAIAHWRSAATKHQQDAVAWVAVRHEIDYKSPALLNDSVVARTWVGTADSLRFERHTAIVRADGKLLARGRTIWCPINRTTGRLTRVNDDLRHVFSVPPERGPTG